MVPGAHERGVGVDINVNVNVNVNDTVVLAVKKMESGACERGIADELC